VSQSSLRWDSRELLGIGFKIIAAAESAEQAERDLEVAVRYDVFTSSESRNISFFEINWADEESVSAALRNAGKVY